MGSSDHVTELALRAGRGDRAALTEFIKATPSDVWRLLAHLGGTDRADDLTQETYLRVMGAWVMASSATPMGAAAAPRVSRTLEAMPPGIGIFTRSPVFMRLVTFRSSAATMTPLLRASSKRRVPLFLALPHPLSRK